MTNSGLIDILESLDWITKSIADRTEAEFVGDETLCFAVAQRLTVVGEAVARLTPELKAKYAAIPWTDIVGLRNILVHEYFAFIGRLFGKPARTMCRYYSPKSAKS